MRVDTCPREADVIEHVTGGGWPQCAEDDLRAHAAHCPVCIDVIHVATLLREEHALACREARLPSAGLVWWRAELKARQEAARMAARPMTFMQVVAAACALAAALTLAGMFTPWLRGAARTLLEGPWTFDVGTVDAASLMAVVSQGGLPLLLAVGAWLVLAPVALYFAFARD